MTSETMDDSERQLAEARTETAAFIPETDLQAINNVQELDKVLGEKNPKLAAYEAAFIESQVTGDEVGKIFMEKLGRDDNLWGLAITVPLLERGHYAVAKLRTTLVHRAIDSASSPEELDRAVANQAPVFDRCFSVAPPDESDWAQYTYLFELPNRLRESYAAKRNSLILAEIVNCQNSAQVDQIAQARFPLLDQIARIKSSNRPHQEESNLPGYLRFFTARLDPSVSELIEAAQTKRHTFATEQINRSAVLDQFEIAVQESLPGYAEFRQAVKDLLQNKDDETWQKYFESFRNFSRETERRLGYQNAKEIDFQVTQKRSQLVTEALYKAATPQELEESLKGQPEFLAFAKTGYAERERIKHQVADLYGRQLSSLADFYEKKVRAFEGK